jgi:methylmalonyl-CoA mutase N-terminal domain/subunit
MSSDEQIRKMKEAWEEKYIKNAKTPIEPKRTISGITIPVLATPEDAETDFFEDVGFPGDYPCTRGVYPTMYVGQPWTMRQYAGFGSAEESNKRFKYLIEQGQTGLSVAFDLPTQIGYDSDDPEIEAEVGRVGVAIDSLRDMELLFDGLPLDKVSTSFTINSTAAIILAMYIAVGEQQGVASDKLRGTTQNDILKEYVARGTYIFPPKPSMRLVTDIIEYCAQKLPRFNPISICGYHMRDAGADAVQELAFTFSNGITYVEHVLERGMDVDAFASRLSFMYATHNDFFEEAAKYRAARRLWARLMKERFGAKDPRSYLMRFHMQTAGSTVTVEQPLTNIVRTTCQTLAAVLGGAQSMHVNSFDEAYTIPTEESVRLSLRTQQVIAHETGVTATVDPLAGSYFVEYLTTQLEKAALERIDAIAADGGMVKAIEEGRIQREITNRAYEYEREIQSGKRIIVGRNKFRIEEEDREVRLHESNPEMLERQKNIIAAVKAKRDNEKIEKALAALRKCAEGKDNLMPFILDAVKAYATVGEITAVMKEVFGEFKQPITV